MEADLALFSHRVWWKNRIQPATIFLENGLVKSIQAGKASKINCPLEDLGQNVIMPGLIDCHVHLNEPGRTHWEGFDTGTKAAAAGGITTIVDMPLNSSPVTTNAAAFKYKLAAARGKLQINCGFWGGIIPENANQLEDLLKSGVLGIKAFLTHSGIDDFPNVIEQDLRKAMPIIAKSGRPLLVHCEIDSPHVALEGLKQNPTSYRAYLNSRPKSWENEAIALIIQLCRAYHCRTHIVHLSSAEAIPQILAAKEEGLPLSVETCPQYLFFNAEEIPDGDTRFKCAPPIREKANNTRLWQALKGGVIDFIATDHSPAPPEIKELESGNFKKAWGGIAGLQFLLSATWTVAKQNGSSLEDIVNWLSARPAQFLGLEKKKGKIEIGYDADLVVWNPDESFVVEEKTILHRHKITPYMGKKLFGKVKATYVDGIKVFNGRTFTKPNIERFIFWPKVNDDLS